MSDLPLEYRSCTHPDHVGDRRCPLTDFKRNGNARTGWAAWCRSCNAAFRSRERAMRRQIAKRPPLDTQIATLTEPEPDPSQHGPMCAAGCGSVVGLGVYVYGERGGGHVSYQVCDRCDLTARASGDDPLRLIRLASFLMACRQALVAKTAIRIHTDEPES